MSRVLELKKKPEAMPIRLRSGIASLGIEIRENLHPQLLVVNLSVYISQFISPNCRLSVIICTSFAEGRGQREGTGNREQGTGNREQGTGNREQGTGNREQGAGNRVQGVGSGD
ncbi:MAG: hypothetical protein QNJ54_35595 [Prochloraceae cyanobacterium]|nr:hypothetical protein [Prochloraceae cyanobacterium]